MFEPEFIINKRCDFPLLFDSVVQKKSLHVSLVKRGSKFKEV
jgi:hypothetical protein